MPMTKVEGPKKEHRVFLYTLSTCVWCKKTKEFLRESGVEYEYLDVDACSSEERRSALDSLKSRNAQIGFPIIIVDDKTLITGYKPDEIREALEL
jgi:glutaredoxin-like protein NrdH